MDKVLIVEDNALNLKLFRDLLTTRKCEVITSRDGVGVSEIVLKEKPNLILMDIQLNGISGIDLIIDLKQNPETKHIPIIAITAFAMKSDAAKIIESGCDMYLPKPVSIQHFFDAVGQFINLAPAQTI